MQKSFQLVSKIPKMFPRFHRIQTFLYGYKEIYVARLVKAVSNARTKYCGFSDLMRFQQIHNVGQIGLNKRMYHDMAMIVKFVFPQQMLLKPSGNRAKSLTQI